jgi:hypothetical protein
MKKYEVRKIMAPYGPGNVVSCPVYMDPNEILNQNREANLAKKQKVNKAFYILDNVGTAKYTVNCHDGITMNPDGSMFFDIHIFHNKQKRNQFVRAIMADGYIRLR